MAVVVVVVVFGFWTFFMQIIVGIELILSMRYDDLQYSQHSSFKSKSIFLRRKTGEEKNLKRVKVVCKKAYARTIQQENGLLNCELSSTESALFY